MKISSLAGGAKALVVAVGVAIMTGMTSTAAYAQSDKAAKARAEALQKGAAAAPELVSLSGITCDVVNAIYVADTNVTQGEKKVKAKTYEVACKGNAGWILTKIDNGGIDSPYNCTQAEAYALKIKDFIKCTLPENQPHYAWLNTPIKAFVADCTVNNARLIGSSTTEPRYDRYEVACEGIAGGILDIPAPGSTTTQVDFRNCLMAEGSPAACQFTSKAVSLSTFQPVIKQASASCEANDIRFVGTRSSSDGYFYEVGCANQPGFILITKLDNSYDSTVGCNLASGIGGCKFTTAEAATGDQRSQYTAALKAADITCTIQDFVLLGTETRTKRDYVEFKCAEKPFGLIGFVPQPDSTGSVNVWDCFLDQTRRNPACTLVTKDQLQKHWDKLIKIARPNMNCDVKEVRYIGESEGVEFGVVAELACANKRGYIAVLDTNRQSLVDTVPCTIAKSRGGEQQCTLPGNGTYSSDEAQ